MAQNSQNAILRGNAVVGQSGGPTVVINQSLIGVIERLRGVDGIERILGARHGVRGITENDFIELHDIPQNRLDRVAQTPSAALGSSRDKPDREYCQKIFKVFEQNNVRYFFYIGGNDSSDTCRIVNELARESGYELRCFHVPKTIDNDLVLNDHTPGFGSAARFVACAFIGDNLDNKALPGIKINVVMGRHAGFLTAASVLARTHDDDGPHLIYLPETNFDQKQFIDDVDRVHRKHGRCLIAVSEGIHDEHGQPMAARLAEEMSGQVERDAHGNVQLSGSGVLGDFLSQLLRDKLGSPRVRADTFGYLQRSFAGCVSETDAEEARMAGRKAAELALAGHVDGSIAIQRVSHRPYKVDYQRVNLADIAGKTRTLDTNFIAPAGNDVKDNYRLYLQPLVGELPVVDSLRMRSKT